MVYLYVLSGLALGLGGLVSSEAGNAGRLPSGYESVTKGIIYERFGDEISDTPGYRYQRIEETGGYGRRVISRYTDLNNKVLVDELTEYDPSGQFQRYSMDQKQINEIGTMEVRGNKVHYTLQKPDGTGGHKTETAEQDLKENTVCVDQMIDYLKAHWDDLKNDKDLDIRFAVVSRKEAIDFKLQKEDVLQGPNGKERLVIRLTPSNFFIRLFVNPIFLTFEMGENRRILEVRGRFPIKRRFKDNDFGDIEGVLRFDYNQGLAGAGS
jgi:hypothetical protein